eukprot:TRINITY_DN67757_c3_g6_i1.p2 TRINITY_DN67757_c3_g6~~TRINITY_DN67757_c3_g6_i1.p2  ORF type:complete len:185 (+),score=15.83 TRINITY_DN67757_c3_g6_i1:42-557(+)
MEAFCAECNSMQEVEDMSTEVEGQVMCLACGSEFQKESSSGSSAYKNFKVGRILTVEPIPKRALKKVLVDVTGDEDESTAVQIVTNAAKVNAGWKVAVALENAIVPAGANLEEDTNVVQVKKASVGGMKSEGMLCDSSMLAWTGGAKGVIQQLPDSFAIGAEPPSSRPRGD